MLISGVARGVLRRLEHPLTQKEKKIELVFSTKKIIGNILVSYTQHKNRYLHQNICLGFLNKSKYFVKS